MLVSQVYIADWYDHEHLHHLQQLATFTVVRFTEKMSWPCGESPQTKYMLTGSIKPSLAYGREPV